MSIIKKISLSFIVFVVIVFIAIYGYFRYQIDHMLGGNTEQVDSSQFSVTEGALALTGVNVLSEDAESILFNQTVLIDDGVIVALNQGVQAPAGFKVIDGTGRFLIPGLIDSHVHLKKSKNDLLLYIANGVTQVGEMTGMEHHFDYNRNIKQGELGPGIFIATPKVTSQSGLKAAFRSIFEKRHQNFVTEESIRAAVNHFKAAGYQAVKLSSDLNATLYYALADEAKKLNMPVIGHLPVGLGLDDLYRSGQSQLSHIGSITLSLVNEFGGLSAGNGEQFLEYVNKISRLFAKNFKEKNITLSSTLWIHKTREQQAFELPSYLSSIELEYQNPGWLEGSAVSRGCLPGDNSYEYRGDYSEQQKKDVMLYLKTLNKANEIITKALVKHGVVITAGTDALGACGMIAGFSMHKELETLKDYGLSNAQVLRSATSAAADWMGIKAGKIKAGYRADLVLLDKNPLIDIRNTKSIVGVMARGKYIDKTQIDNILKAVAKANENSRKMSVNSYVN